VSNYVTQCTHNRLACSRRGSQGIISNGKQQWCYALSTDLRYQWTAVRWWTISRSLHHWSIAQQSNIKVFTIT